MDYPIKAIVGGPSDTNLSWKSIWRQEEDSWSDFFYKIRSNEVYKNYFTSPLYVKTYGKIILILNSADKFTVFATVKEVILFQS